MARMNRDARKLDAILDKTLNLLEEADELVARAGVQPPGPTVKMLGRAASEVLQAREALRESLSTPAAPKPYSRAAAALSANVEEAATPPRRGWFGLPRGRTSFALRTTRDITRMSLRLLLPWRLPNIKVGFAETLPSLEVQRAQTRITQRSDACQRLFAGPLLAAATVVVGGFHLVWKWTRDLNDLTTVVVATAAAWVVGNALHLAWCRFRLLLELLRLRYQLAQARKLVATPAG
jgi:hypothetical protein